MRHIVTLSLVFFSLTHLAKAGQVEGLRIITEKCCNKQSDTKQVSVRSNLPDESSYPFFLSYSELTLIGVIPETGTVKYSAGNQVAADLTIRKKPKNNSP